MHPRRLQILRVWNTFKLQAYRPVITSQVDHGQLISDLASTLMQAPESIAALWAEYLKLVEQRQHRENLGQVGTLSSEEAFIIQVLMKRYRPSQLIEIGTHEGKSTRRLLDGIENLQLSTAVTCYDIEDLVSYFGRAEAKLILKDVTDSVVADVLDNYEPGIIYLDAHPWQLLYNVIQAVLQREDWILAIHDCGRVLCNPKMTIPRDEPGLITMRTGHWERHVLAALLGIMDPLDARLDNFESDTHRVRIFATQHGLALISPKSLLRN